MNHPRPLPQDDGRSRPPGYCLADGQRRVGKFADVAFS
jgi:hypothetical protein